MPNVNRVLATEAEDGSGLLYVYLEGGETYQAVFPTYADAKYFEDLHEEKRKG